MRLPPPRKARGSLSLGAERPNGVPFCQSEASDDLNGVPFWQTEASDDPNGVPF